MFSVVFIVLTVTDGIESKYPSIVFLSILEKTWPRVFSTRFYINQPNAAI